jgi:hypothetical protein
MEPPVSKECFRDLADGLREIYNRPETPKLVRRKVLEAAVRGEDDWTREAIEEAWDKNDVEWKMTAAFGAHYVTDCNHILEEALRMDEEKILVEALRSAASNTDIPGCFDRFVSLARDRNTPVEVRQTAIAQLRKFPSDRVEDVLLPIINEPGETGELANWALREWKTYRPPADLDL